GRCDTVARTRGRSGVSAGGARGGGTRRVRGLPSQRREPERHRGRERLDHRRATVGSTVMKRRAAVTGMGVVTPIGSAIDACADSLLAGRSGVRVIRVFDPASLPTRIAGEVTGMDLGGARDRKIAFALEAARQAFVQASACGTSPGGREGGNGAAASLGVG